MCACEGGIRCPRCKRDDAAWGILPGDWPTEPKTRDEEREEASQQYTDDLLSLRS